MTFWDNLGSITVLHFKKLLKNSAVFGFLSSKTAFNTCIQFPKTDKFYSLQQNGNAYQVKNKIGHLLKKKNFLHNLGSICLLHF